MRPITRRSWRGSRARGGRRGRAPIPALARRRERLRDLVSWNPSSFAQARTSWRSPRSTYDPIKRSDGRHRQIGDREIARRLVADGLHDPANVITRSACGMLCAMTTALSWSVVRAQLSAS